MNHHEAIKLSADLLEAAGVFTLVAAAFLALIRVLARWPKHRWRGSYSHYRIVLGRGILLGLEFLVAADIIRTVTEELVLDKVLTLGLIVLIRTFLSVMLEIELEGRLPWHRHRQAARPPAPVDAPQAPEPPND